MCNLLEIHFFYYHIFMLGDFKKKIKFSERLNLIVKILNCFLILREAEQ